MGDSENVQQPSKKRAALKELSRENPGLDDEENSSELESGTFKMASEKVLATRRIVKVKRKDPSAAAAAPASNPFAGIRLVPSTAPVSATTTPLPESNSTPTEAVAEGKQETHDDGRTDVTKNNNSEAITAEEDVGAKNKVDDETKTPAKIEDAAAGEETEKAKDANQDQVTDAPVDHTGSGITNSSDAVKDTDCVHKGSGGDQTEKEEKEANGNENTDKNGDWKAALSSFQQHSSGENAFTGLASTGFATSSFSFGPTGSESKSVFPKNTDQPSFSFGLAKNGNSSLFGGSSSTSITTKSEGTATAFPSKQEVSVETGEENEEVAFTADSVMFEYLEGGWKERGKGELKVNVSTTGNGKARLVMRSKGNYRLILNASLYPEMKLASMDKKGITFACVNSISEAKNGLSTLALKFKDPSIVEEFRAAIEEHKDSSKAVITEAASAPVKTPENSPRTEDV